MKKKALKLLCIDPGIANLGWSVVKIRKGAPDRVIEVGLIETEPEAKKRNVLEADDTMRRGRIIAKTLLYVCAMHQIHGICIEAYSPVRSSSVAAKLGMVYGVILTISCQLGVPLMAASPKQIKQAVLGRPKGDKKAIAKKVGKHIANSASFKHIPDAGVNHVMDSIAAFVACREGDVMYAIRQAA